MVTTEYQAASVTLEAPEGAQIRELLGLRKYLEDGWLIATTERTGGAVTVSLVKPNPLETSL